MSDEFTGDPAPLPLSAYVEAAEVLGCSVAAIRAVASVESAGAGFLIDGRPKILFERHVFHKLTAGRHATSPAISSPRSGGYLGGAREYDRLRQAMALDRRAALQSASWGRFQVMGFNHAACDHGDVESLVRAMVSGEPAQLAAFVAYIRSNGLDDELRARDWPGFARGYNGSAYARNAYDVRMAQAFETFNAEQQQPSIVLPVLRRGARGVHVRRLQVLLGIASPDAEFGSATHAEVVAFQQRTRLAPDGVVGPATWRALLA